MEQIIIGATLLCAGVGLIWSQKTNHDKAQTTLTWLPALGEIVRSEVTTIPGMGDNALDTYALIIAYRYEIWGQRYVGSVIDYDETDGPNEKVRGTHSGKNETAESFLPEFPVGKNVSVFYNPDNHDEACLERAKSFPEIRESYNTLAGILIFFGIWIIIDVV